MGDRFISLCPPEAVWPQCPAPPTYATPFPPRWAPCGAQPSSVPNSGGPPSWPLPLAGAEEDRSLSASKSHSQAEKRRRDRINAQLATLRKLIPKSDKMDKAALLGSVVEEVKELKRKAVEVSQVVTVPTEVDEVTIDSYKSKEDRFFIKASVCCDDRPELFAELTQALRGLKLTAVEADMASLGGRIKSILLLCLPDAKDGACISNIVHSLRGVLSRIASSSSSVPSYQIKSKRQRFFLPPHHTL